MIYTTGTIAINGNTVTGAGTNFSAPLSLIRVGCTLIAISNPIQIFTITEIKGGTELSVTPAANPAIAAGTKFSILLTDSISVDGLAQDVAETLRYYQGKETELASSWEWWKEYFGDGSALPVGVPVPWPSATPPTGWLKCNGASFSAEKYPELAKAYPSNKLPDLRGEFIRGWDDGRGVDNGRGLLSSQKATLVESFGIFKASGGDTYRFVTRPVNTTTDDGTTYMTSDYDSKEALSSSAGEYPFVNMSASGASQGAGFRVRPRNIAFNYIVRAA